MNREDLELQLEVRKVRIDILNAEVDIIWKLLLISFLAFGGSILYGMDFYKDGFIFGSVVTFSITAFLGFRILKDGKELYRIFKKIDREFDESKSDIQKLKEVSV